MTFLRRHQKTPRSTYSPTSSEQAAIERYVSSNGMRLFGVEEAPDAWFYWLRGKLFVSNIARIWVLHVASADGCERCVHVAFDPLRASDQLQVLLKRKRRAP